MLRSSPKRYRNLVMTYATIVCSSRLAAGSYHGAINGRTPKQRCALHHSTSLGPIKFILAVRCSQGCFVVCSWNTAPIHESRLRLGYLLKARRSPGRWWSSNKAEYQVVVQISPKYRRSFNTLAFGEIKPHGGSLKDGRLELVYYQNPGLTIGDPFPMVRPGF